MNVPGAIVMMVFFLVIGLGVDAAMKEKIEQAVVQKAENAPKKVTDEQRVIAQKEDLLAKEKQCKKETGKGNACWEKASESWMKQMKKLEKAYSKQDKYALGMAVTSLYTLEMYIELGMKQNITNSEEEDRKRVEESFERWMDQARSE